MEKFIPYEKLSKKEKRKMDLAKRQTWGEPNPVTRKPENSKAYNRNKARNWKIQFRAFLLFSGLLPIVSASGIVPPGKPVLFTGNRIIRHLKQ